MIIRSRCSNRCLSSVSCLPLSSSHSSSSRRGPLEFRMNSAVLSIRTRTSNQTTSTSSSSSNQSESSTTTTRPTESSWSDSQPAVESSLSSTFTSTSDSSSSTFSSQNSQQQDQVEQTETYRLHLATFNLSSLIKRLLIQSQLISSRTNLPNSPLTIDSLLTSQTQLPQLQLALQKHNISESKLLRICQASLAQSLDEAETTLKEEDASIEWPSFLILRLFSKISSSKEMRQACKLLMERVERDQMQTENQIKAVLLLSEKAFGKVDYSIQDCNPEFGLNLAQELSPMLTSLVLSICFKIHQLQAPSISSTSLTPSNYISTLKEQMEILIISKSSFNSSSKRFKRSNRLLKSYQDLLQPHLERGDRIKEDFQVIKSFEKILQQPVVDYESGQEYIKQPVLQNQTLMETPSPSSSAHPPSPGISLNELAADQKCHNLTLEELIKIKARVNTSRGRDLSMRGAVKGATRGHLSGALTRLFGSEELQSFQNSDETSRDRLEQTKSGGHSEQGKKDRELIQRWNQALEVLTLDAFHSRGITKSSPLGIQSSLDLLELSLSALNMVSRSKDSTNSLQWRSKLRYRRSTSIKPYRKSLRLAHSRKALLQQSVYENELRIKLPMKTVLWLMRLSNAKNLPEFTLRLWNSYVLRIGSKPGVRDLIELVKALLKLDRAKEAISQVKNWCFEGQSFKSTTSSQIQIYKIKANSNLLNALIHGLHESGQPQIGFEIFDSFTSSLNVEPNASTYQLLMRSACFSRASQSGGMGWGQRSRLVVHQPRNWVSKEGDPQEWFPSLMISSSDSNSKPSKLQNWPTSTIIPMSPSNLTRRNPPSRESLLNEFKSKKNLRSFWSSEEIPAPILMKRLFEEKLFEQHPELSDPNLDCGKNPLELDGVRASMGWWTRREMGAKDFENWMEKKWRSMFGKRKAIQLTRQGMRRQTQIGIENEGEKGQWLDENRWTGENGEKLDQQVSKESHHRIEFNASLFHRYLLLLEHLKSPIMDDYLKNSNSSNFSLIRSSIPSWENSLLVLSWMKHLNLNPSRLSLNLCLLILSEHLPPISNSSNQVPIIQNPIHGKAVFEKRPQDQLSAAGPLHGWLRDWLDEDQIPTEWEVANYFKWGRKYKRRAQFERAWRRSSRSGRSSGKGGDEGREDDEELRG